MKHPGGTFGDVNRFHLFYFKMKSKLHSMKSLKSSQKAKPLKTASFQALGITKVSDFNL